MVAINGGALGACVDSYITLDVGHNTFIASQRTAYGPQ